MAQELVELRTTELPTSYDLSRFQVLTWRPSRVYNIVHYVFLDDHPWVCTARHTSTPNNRPGSASGAAYWTRALRPNVRYLVSDGDSLAVWVTNDASAPSASLASVEPSATRTVSLTTDTLVLADAGGVVECTSGSATTVTVPPNSAVAFPLMTRVTILWSGVGSVAVAAGIGVTVNTPETLSLAKRRAAATLLKTATNTWLLLGYLEGA